MSLPNPGMNFTPFDPLPASDLNDMVENIEALADGSGIDDGAVTPAKRSGGFKIGIIPGSTFGSTGNKAITGVGFQPKLVRFSTIFGDSTVMNAAWGAMDENGNQFAVLTYTTSSTSGRRSFTDGCIGYLSSGSTTSMKSAYVSMDSDGFTLNVVTASSAFDIAYEAYA